MRLLILPAIVISLSAASLQAQEIKAESLPPLVESAIANNPEIKASQSRWQMYKSRIAAATSLEDPMLMFKLQNMVNRYPTAFNQDATTARVIGISQQIPFWGKRDLKGDIARHEAESFRWQVEERKLELARMVKELFYKIYAVDRSLDLVAKNLTIVGDLLKIAESRYTVGQGAQADILKAGLEQSKMLEMQINLGQQRKALVANMNYLLARPQDAGFGSVPDFDLPVLGRTAGELEEAAYNSRPQFKSLASIAEKSKSAGELARREAYPDFNLSFEYMQREPSMGDPGYDMYSLALTFNLPVRKERREAMSAESMAERGMTVEESRLLKNSIGYSIKETLSQLEQRRKLVELYKSGLIPQAEQSLESSLIGYRVGKVDFLTLLDGRTALYNYERELVDSKAEYMMALARLEATIGGELK